MSDFKDLNVWQKAHKFELAIHDVAGRLRRSQYRSLQGQIIRASESIASNIVESRDQPTSSQEIRFLRIAVNSATEVEHHLINARDLGALKNSEWESLTERVIEIRKMLRGLIRSMNGR